MIEAVERAKEQCLKDVVEGSKVTKHQRMGPQDELNVNTIRLLDADTGNDSYPENRVWATQLCTVIEDEIVGKDEKDGRVWSRDTLVDFANRAINNPFGMGRTARGHPGHVVPGQHMHGQTPDQPSETVEKH